MLSCFSCASWTSICLLWRNVEASTFHRCITLPALAFQIQVADPLRDVQWCVLSVFYIWNKESSLTSTWYWRSWESNLLNPFFSSAKQYPGEIWQHLGEGVIKTWKEKYPKRKWITPWWRKNNKKEFCYCLFFLKQGSIGKTAVERGLKLAQRQQYSRSQMKSVF